MDGGDWGGLETTGCWGRVIGDGVGGGCRWSGGRVGVGSWDDARAGEGGIDDLFEIFSVDDFDFHQSIRKGFKRSAAFREDTLRLIGGFVDQAFDFLVDFAGGLFGVITAKGVVAPGGEEGGSVSFAEIDASESAHAVLHDHGSGDIRSAFEVIRSAGTDIAEDDFFGECPCKEDLHLCFEFGLGDEIAIVFGALHGVSQGGHTAWDDGDFVNRIGIRDGISDERVASFVVSDPQFFVFVHDSLFLFQAGCGAFNGIVEFFLANDISTFSRRKQCGFVDEVRKIGTDKSRGDRSDLAEVDVGSKFYVFDVDFEDICASLFIRSVDEDMSVESTGA